MPDRPDTARTRSRRPFALFLTVAVIGAALVTAPIAYAADAPAGTSPTRAAVVPDVTDLAVLGDAVAVGSTASVAGNQPVVGLARTPSGNGAWFVASDGGTFSFGDAVFHGSTGSIVLNKPVVGMAATPSGNGYWLVASDGGTFSFGDAVFHGSTGGLAPAAPIIGMAAHPTGDGYWLVESGGGVHPFGAAPGLGDVRSAPVTMPIVAAVTSPSGAGLSFAGTGSTVVHFLRDGKLAATRRDARPAPVVSTTLTDLLLGPNPFEGFLGYTTAIPSGTTLLGVDVVGDLATVNLSGRFLEGGGTLSLQERTAQVVFTLTAFTGITRVAFRIDGNLVVTIGPGGIPVDPPVVRDNFDALRPDILVTFPAAGQVVAAPMMIVGEANTFEGNVVMVLTDASRRGLGHAQSTGAMGFWGAFAASLDFSPGTAATGTLSTFWNSPKDGQPVAIVDLPVRFRP